MATEAQLSESAVRIRGQARLWWGVVGGLLGLAVLIDIARADLRRKR